MHSWYITICWRDWVLELCHGIELSLSLIVVISILYLGIVLCWIKHRSLRFAPINTTFYILTWSSIIWSYQERTSIIIVLLLTLFIVQSPILHIIIILRIEILLIITLSHQTAIILTHIKLHILLSCSLSCESKTTL